jgi:hypothetical protein
MLSQYKEIMLTLPAIKQLIQKLFNAKEAPSIKLALNMCVCSEFEKLWKDSLINEALQQQQ